MEHFAGETHEVIYELCLDRKGKLLVCKRLGEGGISSAPLDVRKLVENAILNNASSVILAHNHPSPLTRGFRSHGAGPGGPGDGADRPLRPHHCRGSGFRLIFRERVSLAAVE